MSDFKDKLKKLADRHNEINRLIAAGQEVPAELTKNFVTFPLHDNVYELLTADWLQDASDDDLRMLRRLTYDKDAKGWTAFALDYGKDQYFEKYVQPRMNKFLLQNNSSLELYKQLGIEEKQQFNQKWRESDEYKEIEKNRETESRQANCEYISQQYHKAKDDGTNPELVQAVESVLKK